MFRHAKRAAQTEQPKRRRKWGGKVSKAAVIVTLLCVFTALASFGSTYALLWANTNVVNSFTMGEDETEIVEEFEPPAKLLPGIEFKKKVQVQNTGNVPTFVRARVEFSSLTAQNICEPLVYNTANWTLGGDGYWYYKSILAVGDTTPALMETVKIKTSGVTEADMVDFDIIVYQESRQVLDGKTAANYMDASIWTP